jgi:hypothetical protein
MVPYSNAIYTINLSLSKFHSNGYSSSIAESDVRSESNFRHKEKLMQK